MASGPGMDFKSEFDSLKQYGYIIWVVPPPLDLAMDMIAEIREEIERRSGDNKGYYWSNMINILPKLFMTADTYGVHYIPTDQLLVREEPEIVWHLLMRDYMNTYEYNLIRAYTTSAENMSYFAGVWLVERLLNSLRNLVRDPDWKPVVRAGLEELEEFDRNVRRSNKKKQGGKSGGDIPVPGGYAPPTEGGNNEGGEEEEAEGQDSGSGRRRPSTKALAMAPANTLTQGQREVLANIAREAAREVLEGVEALGELNTALESLRARYPSLQVPAHAKGLEPSNHLFARPEEIRRRARILGNIAKLVDEFREDMVEGEFKRVGYPSGYDMSSSLFDMAIKEYMYPEPLKTLRMVTQHLSVERRGGKRFNIYIDRSGSMGELMPGTQFEKVSIAAAVAIGMLLRYGENIKVYAFDTELHSIGKGSMAIGPLLELAADGGTSVKVALEHLAREGDREGIIITDAIDYDVTQELVNKIIDRTRLVILEDASYPPWAMEYIKMGRAVIARRPEDVVEFLAPGITGGS